jgi:hypothetical protein
MWLIICGNHLVYTVDGTHQHLWVDGAHKVSANVGALENLTDSTRVLIGAAYDSSGNPYEFFSGSIKHVSYWDLFLTASTAGSAVPGASASAGMIYDLYNGGCPTDLSQYQSSSILFDGSNDYLQIEKANGVFRTQASAQRTYSIWFKLHDTSAVHTLWYSSAHEYVSINTNGTISIEMADNQVTTATGDRVVNDNQWHHLVVTTVQGGGVGSVYIDGVRTAAGNFTAGTTFTAGDFYIGAKDDGSLPFKGYIDEFSVWSTASTGGQILELYATGSPQNLNNHSNAGNLLAWYRMGDDPRDSVAGGTARVYDQSSNAYHATGSGFAGNYGIVNHGPEGLNAWYRFDQLDTDYNSTKNAYVYNHLTKDMGTEPYLDLKGFASDPTTMFGTSVPCTTRFITCSSGIIYARRTPEHHTGSGIELGYFAGDTLWEAGTQSGKVPFYNSYDDYREDIRGIGKDYTIVPEFRISEHMSYYVNTKNYDFLAANDGFLSLTGSDVSSSSETAFFEKYNHSDFLKYFDIIEENHDPYEKEKTLTLKCKALMKFLPYDGFYPADRTVQLATLFSQSYNAYVNPENYGGGTIANPYGTQPSWRTFTAPLFGPGVLYNSIKSGVAVDWPQMTASFSITGSGSWKYSRC